MKPASIYSLDGRLIRLFLEVYELNSVSRAAERLGLTQSTVSHGLERLRKALGDPLFVKDGRNIAPTPHADYVAPRMREALSAIEALNEPQDYDPTLDIHPITIAANAEELHPELVQIGTFLYDAAPNLPLRLMPLGSSTNVRSLLENASADVVISVRRGAYSPDLDFIPFLKDHQVIFYDGSVRGGVDAVEDYAAARHAALDFGGGRPSILAEYLAQLGIDRNVHVNANNLDLLGDFMRGRDFITTMQSRFQRTVFAGFSMSPLPFDLPPIQYDLVWHKRQSLSKRHTWLREMVARAPNVVQQAVA